jgi:transposase
MEIAVLGIDPGKNSSSVVGLDLKSKVSAPWHMRCDTVIAYCSKLHPCVVAMEAYCRAHHMGRVLVAQGHVVRLMSPDVRPYVKSQKNDDRDAEAIVEAATRPTCGSSN